MNLRMTYTRSDSEILRPRRLGRELLTECEGMSTCIKTNYVRIESPGSVSFSVSNAGANFSRSFSSLFAGSEGRRAEGDSTLRWKTFPSSTILDESGCGMHFVQPARKRLTQTANTCACWMPVRHHPRIRVSGCPSAFVSSSPLWGHRVHGSWRSH